MAELIPQILALPRSEKLQLIALLALELQKEDTASESIPQWQIDLAQKALEEIQSGKAQLLNQEEFWAAIDTKVDQLERKSGA